MQVKVFKKLSKRMGCKSIAERNLSSESLTDMRDEALDALERALELQPENRELQSQQYLLEKLQPGHASPSAAEVVSDLQRKCRGNFEQDTQLNCELNNAVTPFLQLAPLRLEELLYDPYVMLYRDSMYGREISHVRNVFQYCAPRSKLETIDGTKGCSIPDGYSVTSSEMMDRLVDMTGLSLHLERFLVIEYTPRDPFSLVDLYKVGIVQVG